MKNLKVNRKVLVCFSIIVLFSLIIGIVGLSGMSRITDHQATMYRVSRNVDLIRQLETNLEEQRVEYRNLYLYLDTPALVEQASNQLALLDAEFLDNLAYLQSSVKMPEVAEYMNLMQSYYTNEYLPVLQTLVLAIENGVSGDILYQHLSDVATRVDVQEDYVNAMIDIALNNVTDTFNADTVYARNVMVGMIAAVVVAVSAAVALGIWFNRLIARPIVRFAAAAKQLSVGDTQVDVHMDRKDEIGELADAFMAMVDGIHLQAETLGLLATGDYTQYLPVRSDKDIMSIAYNRMVDVSNSLMDSLKTVSLQVAAGSTQIADGAQGLAAGSTQQSASVEHLTLSLESIREHVERNSDSASNALDAGSNANTLLTECLQYMEEMEHAMNEIEVSSASIAKVIEVIDGIAFQTNILALNAAVEAARAGQHGKGFAVVADEVRSLATSCAQAAQETTSLIEKGGDKVTGGHEILKKTSSSLHATIENAKVALSTLQEVAESSRQQAEAVAQINNDMHQVSAVIQSNSATAQQSAAAAEQMSAQSAQLEHMVARFKLRSSDYAYAQAPSALPAEEPMLQDRAASRTVEHIPPAIHLPATAFAYSEKY